MFRNRVFHKLDEIGSVADIDIRGFTTRKQKIQWQNVTPSRDRTQASHEPLIPSPTLSFLS